MPTLKNNSGFFKGSSMTSLSSLICSFNPPIPPKLIWPGSSKDILYTSGSTSRGNIRIIVRVVMSSATLVPCFSFSLSTFDLHPTTYLGPDDAFTITIYGVNKAREITKTFGEITLTSLIVQLLQNFTNDLAYALKSLDVILCMVKLLLEAFDTQP